VLLSGIRNAVWLAIPSSRLGVPVSDRVRRVAKPPPYGPTTMGVWDDDSFPLPSKPVASEWWFLGVFFCVQAAPRTHSFPLVCLAFESLFLWRLWPNPPPPGTGQSFPAVHNRGWPPLKTLGLFSFLAARPGFLLRKAFCITPPPPFYAHRFVHRQSCVPCIKPSDRYSTGPLWA